MTNDQEPKDRFLSELNAGLGIKHGVRVLMLRLLIGWWMVPFMWTFGWILAWLLFGVRSANEMAADMTKAVWFGDA